MAWVCFGQGYGQFEAGKLSELQLLVLGLVSDKYFGFKIWNDAEVEQLHNVLELSSRGL